MIRPETASDVIEKISWPVKTRELKNHYFDTTIWNKFSIRPDDVFISCYGKSGTTWSQQIVSQLLFNGSDERDLFGESPWLELRLAPQDVILGGLETQTHRRYIKTHAPVDTLAYSSSAKYVFVARDPRDMVWSMHNHLFKATPAYYEMVNDAAGLHGPPQERPGDDIRQYFLDFLDNDRNPTVVHPFWDYFRGWWSVRHLPNILFVHYSDLKSDMEAEIRRIAAFLDVHPSEDGWEGILEHCSFDYMKRNADRFAPHQANVVFEGGASTFINKGVNNRWKDTLTAGDLEKYELKLRAELGNECADWITHGRSELDIAS